MAACRESLALGRMVMAYFRVMSHHYFEGTSRNYENPRPQRRLVETGNGNLQNTV